MKTLTLLFLFLPLISFSQSENDSCVVGAVPNSITPDCEEVGCNFFGPDFSESCEVIQFDFKIYNRWGEAIFESTDPKKKWEVTEEIESGVFVWVLSFQLEEEEARSIKGHVTVLK